MCRCVFKNKRGLLSKLFFRLLTWRPAGAEGEHMTTQTLSDKQLVQYTILLGTCMCAGHFCELNIFFFNFIYTTYITVLCFYHFIRLYSFINHVALRTPFPRSQWIFRPALMTSTPSAVLIGLPWRTVGRVSTAQPQAFMRMAPGAGPQPVSLPLHSKTEPGGFLCACVRVLMEVYLYDQQRSRSSAYSQLC